MREERVYKDRHGQWVKESIDEYGRCRREVYAGRRTRRSVDIAIQRKVKIRQDANPTLQTVFKDGVILNKPTVNALTALTGVKYF